MHKPPNSREVMRRLSRRRLLAGASSIAVALPLLRSLGVRADEAAPPPKRLVLMYTPNGVVSDAWWPTNVTSETSFDLGSILQPLAPFRERLLLLSGVDLQVARQGPGGLHQKGIGGLFTGRELQSGTQFVDGCGQTAGWANGISVDQAVAQSLHAGTVFPSLELGVRALDNDVQGRISYAGAGQPLPPINKPSEVFNRLFSTLGASAGSIDALRASRRSVLDTVQSQFSTLSLELSPEDRAKLDAHLTLVRDAEQRLTATSNPALCSAPGRPLELDPASEGDMPLIADLELDLLAAAFACDLTRVASYQISTSLNRIAYPWLGSSSEGHALSHSGPSDLEARAQLVARQTWHAGRLAYFLSRLASYRESDGSTLLDNTLVVWGNEIAVGNTHAHDSIPFLLAGGGWAFRTGRFLTFDHQSHNNLLVSVLNAMGIQDSSFGDPALCTGPLPGLV